MSLLKICQLNVAGWTANNKVLREGIITSSHSDIFCVCETHLNNNDDLLVKGYKWYGHCRLSKHKKAPKTFGGVGIFVKNELLDEFCISILDKTYEGIIALQFVHLISNVTIIVVSAYLPPENSPWGRSATDFFDHLLFLVYTNIEADYIFLCGDLNSRIGSLSDIICDIDHIPLRCVIDEVKNQHGSCFIDFLLESKMCLVNGRISPENNDFTNVSKKGKSLVDYIVVPHENLSSCVHFSVTSCNDILSDFNLVHLIGNNSKVPDHSLLSLTVETSMVITNDKRIAMDHVRPQNINTIRYSFKNVPNEYMNSEAFRELASKFLVDIDLCRDTLPCVDTLYNNFIKLLQVEMDDHLRRINFNKAKLDRYNYFWNDELQKLWKDKKIAEKEFRKCKKHDYKDKYLLFKLACNIFDKKFRQYERHYN